MPPQTLLLPGILTPAEDRYRPLIAALGRDAEAIPKELEVYAPGRSASYGIRDELDGIDRAADAAGFETFHLVGHSAGGAIALAYVAARPGRVRTLALDEPATDFSPEAQEAVAADARASAKGGPGAFAARLVRPGVRVPEPAAAPPVDRVVGAATFSRALLRHRIDPRAFPRFPGPVLFTMGTDSDLRWERMAERLQDSFGTFTVHRDAGRNHLEPGFVADPGAAASRLLALWRSSRGDPWPASP